MFLSDLTRPETTFMKRLLPAPGGPSNSVARPWERRGMLRGVREGGVREGGMLLLTGRILPEVLLIR